MAAVSPLSVRIDGTTLAAVRGKIVLVLIATNTISLGLDYADVIAAFG